MATLFVYGFFAAFIFGVIAGVLIAWIWQLLAVERYVKALEEKFGNEESEQQ